MKIPHFPRNLTRFLCVLFLIPVSAYCGVNTIDVTDHSYQTERSKEDPSDFRLFFASSARSKNRFELSLSNNEIISSGFALSLPFNATLSGGMTLPSGDRIYWLAPKFTLINKDHYALAFGGTNFFIPQSDAFLHLNKFRTLFIVQTYSIDHLSITAGAYQFSYEVNWLKTDEDDDIYHFFNFKQDIVSRDEIMFLVGMELDTGSGFKVITEVWKPQYEGFMALIGPRFYSNRVSFDVAAIMFEEGFLPVPFLNFTFRM